MCACCSIMEVMHLPSGYDDGDDDADIHIYIYADVCEEESNYRPLPYSSPRHASE